MVCDEERLLTETNCSTRKNSRTSENVMQAIIQFTLFGRLHDSLTLQILFRVKPIMLR